MTNLNIIDRAYRVFYDRAIDFPPMSLRAGDAIDSYALPPGYDRLNFRF